MTTPNTADILNALDRQAEWLEHIYSIDDARLLREAADIVRERREYVNALQKARDDLARLIDGAE